MGRGGGGRGGGRGGPLPRDVQVSKKLSKLLRHSAAAEGLTLDAAGYANLADVVCLSSSPEIIKANLIFLSSS